MGERECLSIAKVRTREQELPVHGLACIVLICHRQGFEMHVPFAQTISKCYILQERSMRLFLNNILLISLNRTCSYKVAPIFFTPWGCYFKFTHSGNTHIM